MKAISKISALQTILILTLARTDRISAKYFRTSSADNFYDDDEFQVRQLGWNFMGIKFSDDEFFENYDKDEIPSDKSDGDRVDYLRDDDVCVGKDGSISRSNCRTPPSCDGKSSTLGRQKLCINRVFEPGNKDSWYVVAMKCIPEWENCDKCFCGYMKRSYAMDGYCKYDDSSVNDDRVDVDCDKIGKIKMMGRSFNYDSQSSDESDKKKSNSNDKKKKDTSSDSDSNSSISSSKSSKDKKKKDTSSDSDSNSSSSSSKSSKDKKKKKDSSDSDKSKKNKKKKKKDSSSSSSSKSSSSSSSSKSKSKSKKDKKKKGKK